MSESESNNSNQSSRPSREKAVRLFAEELQQVVHQYKDGDGEYAPNYVLLPSGERANRVFLIGTLTDVEDIGDDDEYWRATVNDSTGNFMVYAGQYQPEAAATLSQLEAPEFIAVSGKVKTFETDDGDLLANVRPENLEVIDRQHRDRWVAETAEQTLDRLEEGDGDFAEMLEEQYGEDLPDAKDAVRDAVVRALENLEDEE